MASPVTSPYDLTTVAAVVRYLGGEPTVSAASYPLLQALITAISRQCATYCSRDFRLADYSQILDGPGGPRIVLNNGPVSAVSSVAIGGTAVQAATAPMNVGFTFVDRILYFRGGTFCNGIQNVAVSYTSGYVTPGQAADLSPPDPLAVTLPQDLQESVIEAVALRWRRIPNEDKTSVAIGDQSTNFINAAIPSSVKQTWDAYKLAMLW